ncbi:MAG: LCP family protein [Clostridia bacterium]|nr:LCP family protein [Clostridia bacterium]
MFKRLLCALLALMILLPTAALADKPRDITPLETVVEPPEGMHHYLFACVDNWKGNAKKLGNTDGVILVTLDTAAKRVLFTTFSREMLIKRPDGGIGRFTYIAKNYGPEALCDIVSTHFGAKVDQYIIFSMDNVQTIIDAMGGVEITVTDAEADYLNRYRISRDSTTPSMGKGGTYLFGGHAAVIYMRIRKVGGDGDSGRTRRMRTVLTTLAGKYANASLDDALQLLTAVSENVVTTNMTMADLFEAVGYAIELRGVTPEGLQMPPDSCMEPITYAGMSTRQVDFDAAREILKNFLYGDAGEPDAFDVVE